MNEIVSTGTATPANYWKEWIENWKDSSLSQRKFCKANDLPYARFLYWRRKHGLDSGTRRATTPASGGFATVDYRAEVSGGLTLSLPNGLVLRGISADNVPVVRQLLEQL